MRGVLVPRSAPANPAGEPGPTTGRVLQILDAIAGRLTPRLRRRLGGLEAGNLPSLDRLAGERLDLADQKPVAAGDQGHGVTRLVTPGRTTHAVHLNRWMVDDV